MLNNLNAHNAIWIELVLCNVFIMCTSQGMRKSDFLSSITKELMKKLRCILSTLSTFSVSLSAVDTIS